MKPIPTQDLYLRFERADLAPRLAQAMYDGQRRALRQFGLEGMATKPPLEPGVLLVVARTGDSQLCAGLRLQRRTADRALPLEAAVELPEASRCKLDELEPRGLAELGALWVDPAMRSEAVADIVVHFAITVARTHHMPNLVSLGARHSIPLALRTGFRLDSTEPAFTYPDSRYQSRLVWRPAEPIVPHLTPGATRASR